MRKKAGKMRSKNNFNLKEEYKKSWSYLSKSKKFILIIVAIFFLFTLVGFFLVPPKEISDQIFNFIKELLKQTEGMSPSELIIFIFSNNLQSSFFGMIFGVLLGIFPVISAISNGYLLGFVSSISVKSAGVLSLWRIFPHGVFELPAVFISLGLGIKLSTFLFKEKKLEKFKEYFSNSLRVFLLVVIPLLIIASIIEGILIFFVG